MKIAALHGSRDLRIEERSLDTRNLGSHDLWVDTELTGFKNGTDRGNYEGAERVPDGPDYPRAVGDSNFGTILGVGSDVASLQVGDRVVSREPHQSEYVADESRPIVKVPDGVHSEDAVFAHLYTLSALCYRKAFFQPGENVAVIGLGVVALGPLFGARVLGPGSSDWATAPCGWRWPSAWAPAPRKCLTTRTSPAGSTSSPPAPVSTW